MYIYIFIYIYISRFPKPGHGGAEEGSLIVSFFLSLINMSHSMYSVKNSHHPNYALKLDVIL